MSDERDPVVARALRELAVPEHGPDFWEGLEARLAAEDLPRRRQATAAPAVRSSADEAGEDPDIATVVSLDEARTRRGTSRGRLIAIAAVAAALLVAVGIFRSAPDNGEQLRTAGRGGSSTTAQPDPGQPGKASEMGAEDAVVEWFEAIAAGDAATATELLGPRSRRYLEALRLPVEDYLRESGGYGETWAGTTDRSVTEFALPTESGEDIRIVVIAVGSKGGASAGAPRTDAIPAVLTAEGRWVVEPVAIDPVRGGRLEMITPQPGENGLSGVTPDAVLEAGASGKGTFFFSVDEAPLTKVAGRPSGGGVRGSFDPPGEMTSRTHSLLVAYLDGDTIAAFATTFLVEG